MAAIQFLCLCVIFLSFSTALSAPIDDNQCGVSDYPARHAGERIINGVEVPQGKYPWLAYIEDPPGCTATVVSKRFILTAGHCIKGFKPDEYTVKVGSVDKRKGLKLQPKRLILHEKYAKTPRKVSTYDIGLIELSEELTYSTDVRPICLSAVHQEADSEKNVVISGWGDRTGERDMPNELLEGSVRVVEDKVCGSTDEYYDPGPMICLASHNHTQTFSGDSGGPAMVQREGRWTQIGITSYGARYPSEDNPNVDARVSQFCGWIAEKTDNEVRCDA
ncbi:trypsin domain-containing protein [Ditylenchus destructor]|nr:trypsin domain-containing protein [Ditylenchus destructor]